MFELVYASEVMNVYLFLPRPRFYHPFVMWI